MEGEWNVRVRLKRNLLVVLVSGSIDSIRTMNKGAQQRCRSLSLAADGIMTRVPQMTRDAYLMARLYLLLSSCCCVFVHVALERVGGARSRELTKLEGGKGRKNSRVQLVGEDPEEGIKRPMTPSRLATRFDSRLKIGKIIGG